MKSKRTKPLKVNFFADSESRMQILVDDCHGAITAKTKSQNLRSERPGLLDALELGGRNYCKLKRSFQ